MANVRYWEAGDAEAEAAAEQIRARRGGRLLNLDRVLLHCPPAARGWNAFMGAIRNETTVPDFYRELAICAVGALTEAAYEIHHHRPLLMAAGATAAQAAALEDVERAMHDVALFDERARAVLALVYESVRRVQISTETIAAARAAFPTERTLVELILITAAYNMVSRVVVGAGLEIDES